jgi:endonuclease/exonuclease/phosphatase family metal-dependent hydrolase
LTEAPDLKVVSYNLGRFSLSDRKAGISGRKQCVDSVFAYLKRQDADIICLQEFYVNKEDFRTFKSYLRRHMPGYHSDYYLFTYRNGAFGNVTLSKVPVSGKGVLKFDESTNLAIYTDHKVGERRFRVYNCHFESYNISFTGLTKAFFRADGDAFSETGIKMKKSISRRPKQVDKVFSNIEKCPYEAFVCGDFNDNPMSYTYYRMTKGRTDAFVRAGAGLGATYSRLWPLLRIDYVLVPDRFKARNCEVHRVKFSDHYPVVAEIEF